MVGNNNCSSAIAGGVTIIRVEPHPMPRMPAGVASAGTHRRRNSIPTKRNPKKRHRFRHVLIYLPPTTLKSMLYAKLSQSATGLTFMRIGPSR